MSDWTFFRRVLIAAAVIVLGLLIWRLADALLLLFGATLIGLVLSGAAENVCRHTGLPRWLALTVVVLLVIGVFGGAGLLFGTQISAQLVDLWNRLPAALDAFEQRFGLGDISGRVLELLRSNTGNILFQITSWASLAVSVLGNAVLLLISALFVAAQPELYRQGAVPDGR